MTPQEVMNWTYAAITVAVGIIIVVGMAAWLICTIVRAWRQQ
jgi:hypothetical protein